MKTIFYILPLLFLSTTLHAEDASCVDMWTQNWVIVQKLDNHHYEMTQFGDPYSYHMILHTKKAIFHKTGLPVGVKAKRGSNEQVDLRNGFTTDVGVYTECGLMPLDGSPESNSFLSVRNRLKEDRHSEKSTSPSPQNTRSSASRSNSAVPSSRSE